MRMSWWEWTAVALGSGAGIVILMLGDAYGGVAAFALVGTLLAHAANREIPGPNAIKRVLSVLATVLWVVFAFNIAMEFGTRWRGDLPGLPERLAAAFSL